MRVGKNCQHPGLNWEPCNGDSTLHYYDIMIMIDSDYVITLWVCNVVVVYLALIINVSFFV